MSLLTRDFTPYPGTGKINNPTAYGTQGQPLGALVTNVVQAITAAAGLALLFYLIFGAFRYLTSAGDDKQVQAARKIMTNAVIGLIIIAGSFFIVEIAGVVLGIENILSPIFPGP